MNSVILIGRLTADPATHAGEKHESATFRLAVPRKATDGADFVDIVTFDKLAANCGEYLTKGREVSVVGRLHLNEWTSRDGEKRSRLQVIADVEFLDSPKKALGGVGPEDPRTDSPKPATRPATGTFRRKAS
ncbi:MAG: single-strand DNA-binding protein [Actinomycetota bacterium]|nr:single-strand DNA-binding protein [Actinomycetota bacterium]